MRNPSSHSSVVASQVATPAVSDMVAPPGPPRSAKPITSEWKGYVDDIRVWTRCTYVQRGGFYSALAASVKHYKYTGTSTKKQTGGWDTEKPEGYLVKVSLKLCEVLWWLLFIIKYSKQKSGRVRLGITMTSFWPVGVWDVCTSLFVLPYWYKPSPKSTVTIAGPLILAFRFLL